MNAAHQEESSAGQRILRVGLVGFGAVARTHMDAYRALADVRVVAVADRRPAQAEAATKQYGVQAFESAEAMLDQIALDIVCILTPPATHEQLVALCARAKVHVLCEKPMALSVESCQRMIDTCRAQDVRLCYGASYRYLPALMVARDKIRAGAIGEVLIIREVVVGGAGIDRRRTLGYEHYPKGGPGGSGMGLCDHGIHLVDAFSWLTDSSAVRVSGRGNISGDPQGPEFLHVEYANGAIGELLYEDGTYSTDLPNEGVFGWAGGWGLGANGADTASGAWQPHPGCIHVHGSEGSLRIFYYANTLFWRNRDGVRQVRLPDSPFPANFKLQLAAFAQAIRTNEVTPVPGEVGLEAWRTVERVYAGPK